MTLTTRIQNMIRQKAEALNLWIGGFLRDCKVRDLSTFTIEFYRAQLAAFEAFCRAVLFQGTSRIRISRKKTQNVDN